MPTETATPAECAAWLGIPLDQLEDLVEHPAVARALFAVRKIHDEWYEADDFDTTMRHAGLRPEQIWAQHDLPVVDPDGIDLNKLRLELELMRGAEGVVEERKRYGMTFGRMQKAEAQAKDLGKRKEQALDLLQGAKRALKGEELLPNGEIVRTVGGDPMLDVIEKRVQQAIECLEGKPDGN